MNNESNIQVLQDQIDQLNKEAWNIRVNDSTQSHVLSKKAFLLAEDINYAKGKAEGYRTFAFCLIRLSKHIEALEYSEKSLALFESLNDLDGKSSIYAYFGIIQRSLGNYSASLEYLFKSLELSQQTGNKESESLTCYHIAVTYKYLGEFETALTHLLQSLSISRQNNYWISESYSLNLIGLIYFETGDLSNALDYYHQSLSFRQKAGDKWGEAGCLDNIGIIHFKLKDNSAALDFCSRALSISRAIADKKGEANSLFHLGNIYEQLADFKKASACYNDSLLIRRDIADKKGETEILLFLAGLYLKEDLAEKSQQDIFELLNKALQLGEEMNAPDLLAKIHLGFYTACKHFNRYQEALTHIETHISLSKEIHSDAVNQKIQNLEISYKAEKSRKEAEIYRLKNVELANLYEESNRQKEEIEITLAELRSAQAQLIQSEKMASLGELTAGIAHEIQNPLNFVNNFSEVNKELLTEMNEEIAKGNFDEVKALAKDVTDNEEKIIFHGKRADAIVKGMLQHSRSTNNATKEPTDINALADEYLRLAYHGLRAKDKSFNATMKTDFDESIGKINVIPQDIGRVILNLITNAFYVVDEKKKSPHPLKGGEPYEPTVTVTTKKLGSPSGDGGKVEISVKDNGNGIPQKVMDKIFQPFFTTKPTGKGTGLGLSMSYDIVTKGHGGELKVETKEGEGAEFIIILPNKP
ncbi:MAG: tetratricopeptide repeat protein [Chitinophagaceae bacterium]|nr:tetratricopeptide repeat protein [Chitinophagaceae bacterium]